MDVRNVANAADQRANIGKTRDVSSQTQSKISNRSEAVAPDAGTDKITISPEAQAKNKIAAYMEKIDKLPEVREDVVARVKSNLEKGEYSSREVAKKTAERMLGE